jgi:murein DD-endopeptidase MepM/ murein hydrolase activator NlpD
MALADIAAAGAQTADPEHRAAEQVEAYLMKQVLLSSGLFKGSGAAGSSIHAEMFADALADAVSHTGVLGLASQLAPSAPAGLGPPLAVGARVTSGYGARVDPFDGENHVHTGVDLGAPEGTPILAAADGVVSAAGPRGGYGTAVELQHGGGVSTLYAHASELLVQPGEHVTRGQTIARVGHTGRATGDHLHWEVRVKGTPVNPTKALKTYSVRADDEGEKLP